MRFIATGSDHPKLRVQATQYLRIKNSKIVQVNYLKYGVKNRLTKKKEDILVSWAYFKRIREGVWVDITKVYFKRTKQGVWVER